MQNPKAGGSRWVPDILSENIDTYTETNTPEGGTEQSAKYKIVDAHPIIGGVLDKLAFFRTHASAVWYNKMKNITVLQKLDNLASNIGVLADLATTDKTSLVNAVNELNVKITGSTSGNCIVVSDKITAAQGANKWCKKGGFCTVQYDFSISANLTGVTDIFKGLPPTAQNFWVKIYADTSDGNTAVDALVMIKTVGNEGYVSSNWRNVMAGRYMGTLIYQVAE